MNKSSCCFERWALHFQDNQNKSVMKELRIIIWNGIGIIWDFYSIMTQKLYWSFTPRSNHFLYCISTVFSRTASKEAWKFLWYCLMLPSSSIIKCKVIWRDTVFLRTILILLFFVVFFLNDFTPLNRFKWKPAFTKFSSFRNFFNCMDISPSSKQYFSAFKWEEK